MSATPHNPPSQGSAARDHLFWIVPDVPPFATLVPGLFASMVPEDRQWTLLSSAFEDWCLDNLTGPVLAQWSGLALVLHFACVEDQVYAKLAWL
ncbi:hypothetical protein [Sphingobium baderi]|uniref:hypothetical protein n=1 Tax=Sphingobium baderi TaxID=1332080 RepID=UPI002B40B19E|nr:hypothetical protein [Sphingobium baderi]WRD78760.1 hypothetical protein QQ987_20465 [Sphingobium baderi]